jgi:hypothetical protein
MDKCHATMLIMFYILKIKNKNGSSQSPPLSLATSSTSSFLFSIALSTGSVKFQCLSFSNSDLLLSASFHLQRATPPLSLASKFPAPSTATPFDIHGPDSFLTPPSSASAIAEAAGLWVFFCYFLRFSGGCYCLQLNLNRLGFKLFVCVGDPFSTILSLSLFGFFRSYTRSKFLFLNVFGFLRSRIGSKFMRVFLLPMVFSILMGRSFYKLHFQATSTFLNFLQGFEVLVVYLY